MQTCTRIGCSVSYDPSNNSAADCRFHPGSPLFHEGLKSYTCCKDTNKPVDSFEDFLKIPGCTSGSHSSEQSEVKAPVVTANAGQGSQGANTSSAVAPTSHAPRGTSATNGKTATPALPVYKSRPSTPSTVANDAGKLAEEEDPEDVVIPPGAQCRRQGCKAVYNASTSRSSEECQYHPLSAIFHEGSKGYACCKRRVLDFSDFLQIPGCKQGRHCFVGPAKDKSTEEAVDCRSDMYQTPTQVICSIFGKGADKGRSSITFDEWELAVDLRLAGNKRFQRSYQLFGPIDTSASAYRILGTKVELTLVKADGRSWPQLEVLGEGKSNGSQITFGVDGRTGSVGAKEFVYRGDVVHS